MIDMIVTMVVLIALSGFFSGTETALFSLSSLRVTHLVKEGEKNAKILQKIKDKPHVF